ncbi:MAG: gliding motility-associated C-terminal domain-containing protein [Saprospiraceae bacterium]
MYIIRWTSLFLFLVLSGNQPIVAQKAQALHWYFGDHYGLDFSNGAPVADYESSMYTYEACVTMSDKNGNLLFYTNAGGRSNQPINGYIWNRNHEIMEGGDLSFDKGGGYSAAQGAIAFEKPGADNIYMLFTVDENETLSVSNNMFPKGKGARYFEIDMNANGGLGQVTLSNAELFSPAFEYQAATQHSNCQDYWLIVPTGHYKLLDEATAADSFYVYLVDNNGPTLMHKTPIPEANEHTFDEYGPLKISPDGSQMTCGSLLYYFDNSNGLIEFREDLQTSINLGYNNPIAFSPNGKLLYEFKTILPPQLDSNAILRIHQYDISVEDLSPGNSLIHTSTMLPFANIGGPQLAPDGNLYFMIQNGYYTSPTSLAVIQQPNEKNAGAVVNLNFLTLSNVPDNRFLRFGNYSDHLFYNEATLAEPQADTIILSCDSVTDIKLTAPPGMDCYFWSTGSLEDSTIATEEGLYWVEYWQDCQMNTHRFLIVYENEIFDVDLGEDFTICGEESISLIAPEYPNMNYLWQNGDTTNNLTINQRGTYSVLLQQGDCKASDTIVIGKKRIPEIDLGEDLRLCLLDSLKLDFHDPDWENYEWQDESNEAFFNVTASGIYSLVITNECGEAMDDIEVSFAACGTCPVYVPTAFSPNGVANNEVFKIYSTCDLLDYELQVFDRWGNQVFGSANPEESWNGFLKGTPCQSGIYVYKLDYKWLDNENQLITEQVYGNIHLFR